MTDVLAPAVNPWDVAAIVTAALDVLRLDAADADADRIERKAIEATQLVDAELDCIIPWATAELMPAPVVEAATHLTVELYRRKDAPGGITDSWSSDGTFLRLSADVMKGVRAELRPYKARRGLA